MIVYADVLFILNFSMDYLILHLVSCQLHKGKHFLLCSLLGGLYGIAAVRFPLLGTAFFQIMFSAFIVTVAYRPENASQFTKAFFLFLSISFLIGGVFYAIFLKKGQGKMINGILYFDFSFLQFMLVTLLCWGGLTVGSMFLGRIKKHYLRTVMITNRGKNVVLPAMLDTGCELTEPLTGFPVMVAEYDCICEILSEELRGIIVEKNIGPVPERIYQIPFSTVKEGRGLILAFRPESVTVFQGKRKVILNRVLVGIVHKKLTGNQSYSALIPPAMTI